MSPRTRRREPWLTNARGRTWYCHRVPGAPPVVGFEVLRQVEEGALWRRIYDATGTPQRLPLDMTRAEFEVLVAHQVGDYQLLPVTAAGVLQGDPPQVVTVGGRRIAPRTPDVLVAMEVRGQDRGPARVDVRPRPVASSPRRR